jgi:small subunit ribosomal protein S8
MPLSRIKLEVCKILKEEGYVKNFRISREKVYPELTIFLKYGGRGECVVSGLKRVSKPGLRIYVGKDDIHKVLSGLGITILSTSRGVMTGEQARQVGVGGEVLCNVW